MESSSLLSLENRVAVISGAASGIGAETAVLFASAGADVVLGAHGPDGYDGAAVVERVKSYGRRSVIVDLDVRSTASVDTMITETMAVFGRVDIVVANAGIARREERPELVSDSAWQTTIDLNLNGVWRCFRAAIPHMRAAGYGRLIATSSVSGPLQAWVGHSAYAASKAGLIGIVGTLAVELGPAGITCNAIAPGVIESPQSLDRVNSLGPDGLAEQRRVNPVRRIGTCREVAVGILYLASVEAGFVNGHVLVMDGGMWLAGSE